MNFFSNKPFQFCFSSDLSQSSRKSVKSLDLRPSREMLDVNLNPTFFFGGSYSCLLTMVMSSAFLNEDT